MTISCNIYIDCVDSFFLIDINVFCLQKGNVTTTLKSNTYLKYDRPVACLNVSSFIDIIGYLCFKILYFLLYVFELQLQSKKPDVQTCTKNVYSEHLFSKLSCFTVLNCFTDLLLLFCYLNVNLFVLKKVITAIYFHEI